MPNTYSLLKLEIKAIDDRVRRRELDLMASMGCSYNVAFVLARSQVGHELMADYQEPEYLKGVEGFAYRLSAKWQHLLENK